MVDLQTVCCMCGDVGFPDKLFRCNKCRYRYQHSYCSNYYMSEYAEPVEECDWCQSEGKSSSSNNRHGKKSSVAGMESGASSRSEYSGDKIKQQHVATADHTGPSTTAATADQKAKSSPSGAPSPRPTARRYKLLKDVMC